MKNALLISLLVFSSIPALFADEAADRGLEIMTLVDNRPESRCEQAALSMTITDRRGRTRERSLSLYSLDEGEVTYSLMYFEAPADVAGVGFLTIDHGETDDQWLYMPALGRSRRIASSSKDESFMGTDFTYEDLENRDVEEDDHRFLSEENQDGKNCWVVESVPRNESAYSRRVCWVDKKSLLMVRVDFYDQSGTLEKRLLASDLRKDGVYWTAYRMEMTNLAKNQSTVLLWDEIHRDGDYTSSRFTVGTLEGGWR